jgi:hypothetical protein
MPTMRLAPADRDYAIVCAVPVDHPGLRFVVGRQSCDTRALEGCGDRESSEIGCGERCQSSAHLADRCTGSGDDVGTRHGELLRDCGFVVLCKCTDMPDATHR